MRQQNPRLQITVIKDATVARFVDDKILDEVGIAEIGEQLKVLVTDSSKPKIVLDFSAVSNMSSSALGMLVTIHKRIQENSGELRLACIQPSIYEVFVITRLKGIFQIYTSVEDALADLTD